MKNLSIFSALTLSYFWCLADIGADGPGLQSTHLRRQCVLDSGIVTVLVIPTFDKLEVSWVDRDGKSYGKNEVDLIRGRDVVLDTFEIAPWGKASLVIGFRIKVDSGWEYGVATITPASLRQRPNSHTVRSFVFERLNDKFRIASVDGTFDGDSISVILAKHEIGNSGQRPIAKMVSYTHVCPNPNLDDGNVRHFTASN